MKYPATVILLILAFSLAFEAEASDIQLGAASYHFDRDDKWCESNPLLGYTSDKGFSGLIFKNSLCNWTAFANRRYVYKSFLNGDLELATRYGVYLSEEKYILGSDIGPIATVEVAYKGVVISYLGEAISLHLNFKL
jgi:hypothetical protein